MEETEKIDNVVQVLLADYERQDGFLSNKQIERTFEKRKLSVTECNEVTKQLIELGINIEEEEDENGKIIINGDGVDIDLKDGSDSFQMKIDEDGVQIKAGEKSDN